MFQSIDLNSLSISRIVAASTIGTLALLALAGFGAF
jgi:hypothetical protein